MSDFPTLNYLVNVLFSSVIDSYYKKRMNPINQ